MPDDIVDEALEYISSVVDSGAVSDIPLRPGETLHQCSKCGCRLITSADEQPPEGCKCDYYDQEPDREWIAVREKSIDPDPLTEAVVDVAERWPIDADAAREFLMDVGYTPPRRTER